MPPKRRMQAQARTPEERMREPAEERMREPVYDQETMDADAAAFDRALGIGADSHEDTEGGAGTGLIPPGIMPRPLNNDRDEGYSPLDTMPANVDLLVGALSDRLEQQERQTSALQATLADLVRLLGARAHEEAPSRAPEVPEAGGAPLLHGGSSGFSSTEEEEFQLRRRPQEEMRETQLERELAQEREKNRQLAELVAGMRAEPRGSVEQLTGEQTDLLSEFSFLAGTGSRRRLEVPASVIKQRAHASTDTKATNKADTKLVDLKTVKKFTPEVARVMGFRQWYEDNLEREFGLMNPNEATCIMYLRTYVEEGMYTTLQSTLKADIANLGVWLDRLASLYPDKEFVSTYVTELGQIVQKRDEFVTLYLTRLAGTWNKAHPKRAPISDSEFVEVFVKGLAKKLREAVGKAGAHQSLVWALSVARQREKVRGVVQDLNAVAKKTERGDKKTPCKYFEKGDCRRGNQCKFLHQKAKVNKVGAKTQAATASQTGVNPSLPPPPTSWQGAYVNIAPADKWKCTLRECAGVQPHMYVDCVAPSRICKKCGKGGHHEARCPQERCNACGRRGIAWWMCCKRRGEDRDRENGRRGEERGARGGRGGRGGGRGGKVGAGAGNGSG